jgi:Na+/H+-dicarboxylate symporter
VTAITFRSALQQGPGAPRFGHNGPPARGKHARTQNLYVQVLIAIALGVLLGYLDPPLGEAMRPLGDGFIKLVKMVIAPVIFLTVVLGIAKMGDLKHVGRIGVKALVYFELVTTLALVVGLVVSNLLQPGAGMNVSPGSLDPGAVANYKSAASAQSVTDFVLRSSRTRCSARSPVASCCRSCSWRCCSASR